MGVGVREEKTKEGSGTEMRMNAVQKNILSFAAEITFAPCTQHLLSLIICLVLVELSQSSGVWLTNAAPETPSKQIWYAIYFRSEAYWEIVGRQQHQKKKNYANVPRPDIFWQETQRDHSLPMKMCKTGSCILQNQTKTRCMCLAKMMEHNENSGFLPQIISLCLSRQHLLFHQGVPFPEIT